MTEELDPFDWALAEALGMTVVQMRDNMSNAEFHTWRAFFTYRAAKQDLALKAAKNG